MNRESDQTDLVPYNFDPEYLVEEITSSAFKRRNNHTITSLFCTTRITFLNVNNPSKILIAIFILLLNRKQNQFCLIDTR